MNQAGPDGGVAVVPNEPGAFPGVGVQGFDPLDGVTADMQDTEFRPFEAADLAPIAGDPHALARPHEVHVPPAGNVKSGLRFERARVEPGNAVPAHPIPQSAGTEPQGTGRIERDRPQVEGGAKRREPPAIEAIQPFRRGAPEEAVVVERDVRDLLARKPRFHIEVLPLHGEVALRVGKGRGLA